ncbi:UNVERIFIED_CONTAM: hypothetical protein Sangu_2322900 [Sesamum angustifolium]|uniref:Leucine-rich repeat-containing N-terminal plant-type domain-containing protein n=1 Tax=Sesamum angustifolium TaxID=2727405 RepID=A0AAW2L8Z3_9LAMI
MTSSIIVECLIFLFFFYFACNPATCSIYEVDLRALLSFKGNIIDPRGALDSWRYNETVTYCTWKGISCGSRHRNRVVFIDLNSQGLVGFVSPHLDNKLDGNVPFELSSLSKLEALGLAKNSLSGTIPSFIGNFTFLIELSLRGCGFQGEIPESLVRLRNMQFLNLAENRLTGRLPSGLYNISSISRFSMTSNLLQGNIPSNIGLSLPNLQFLGLGHNDFTGLLPVSLSNASFFNS